MERCHFQKAHLYTFVHIATEKDPQLQQSSYREQLWFQNVRFWFQNVRFGSKTDVFGSQNSSREDTPEHASAAWDHWTGRDCAAGRPSRSLCLDLTSGPPLASASFALAPDPLEHGHRITDTRTAPCLNARGCWIYQGRGPAQEVPLPQRHPAEWSIAPQGVHLANRCACSESLGRTRLATLLQV